MKSKRGFIQVPFSWLFAIIIGAIILFFAIYTATKLIKTETTSTSAQTGKEIDVLLNPLETSFGEESTTPLTLSIDSRLSNKCSTIGIFGSQIISVSQQSGGTWQNTAGGPSSYNKYIFSDKMVQGKDFYLFSKPFEMPFKVSDLIYLTAANTSYCFIGIDDTINAELSNLHQPNLFTSNCPAKSIKVCFDNTPGCDITVNDNLKTVVKNGTTVYYETDALMYGAIFSDPSIYECQVVRLMGRLRELSLVYNDKQTLVSSKGCPIQVNLLGLASAASSVSNSADLISAKQASDEADYENTLAYCPLW